ncbi:MAG: hypothetical protein WC718_07275 [Phycisphaerales bacterium]|jgi:hypothetical protein
MSYELKVECITGQAAADLSTKQFSAVALGSTTGKYNVTATRGARVDGILQNAPAAAGRGALVAVGGVTKATVQTNIGGRSIAYGTSLINSTKGYLMASSTGGTAFRFARAEESLSTGTARGIIAVRITNEGPTSTA